MLARARSFTESVISVHFGENQFGQSLGEAVEDYQGKLIRPLRSFAKSAFRK